MAFPLDITRSMAPSSGADLTRSMAPSSGRLGTHHVRSVAPLPPSAVTGSISPTRHSLPSDDPFSGLDPDARRALTAAVAAAGFGSPPPIPPALPVRRPSSPLSDNPFAGPTSGSSSPRPLPHPVPSSAAAAAALAAVGRSDSPSSDTMVPVLGAGRPGSSSSAAAAAAAAFGASRVDPRDDDAQENCLYTLAMSVWDAVVCFFSTLFCCCCYTDSKSGDYLETLNERAEALRVTHYSCRFSYSPANPFFQELENLFNKLAAIDISSLANEAEQDLFHKTFAAVDGFMFDYGYTITRGDGGLPVSFERPKPSAAVATA